MPPRESLDASTIPLRMTSEGVVLPVQAQPGARRNGVVGVHNGRLKVAVTQVAEKGKANPELVKVLAAALHLPRSAVTLQKGATTPLKEFLLADTSVEEVRQRIKTALGGPGSSG